VKSIAVCAWPYPLNRATNDTYAGQIAGYVGSFDYHLLIQEKASTLIEELRKESGQPFQAQVFCDSSPVLERELAVRAGLGWIGRNSCLISPEFGSAFVLAEIFLDIDLSFDKPFDRDLCGTCTRCQTACPTRCIIPDRTIDARRCISNLTIENKGPMPINEEKAIGTRLFGCDVCQAVCPWNHKILAQEQALGQITDTQFKLRYRESPILRAKRRGWIRNLCTVLANLNCTAAYEPILNIFTADPDPLCRASAARALTALDREKAFFHFNKQRSKEFDPLVTTEIYRLTNENSLQ
jgi:epoxyqueuosine reductase